MPATCAMSADPDVDELETPKSDETATAIDAFLQSRSVARSQKPVPPPRTRSKGRPRPENAEATGTPRRKTPKHEKTPAKGQRETMSAELPEENSNDNNHDAKKGKPCDSDGGGDGPAATPEGSHGSEDDDYLLPARVKREPDGMTPYGRIQCCICRHPRRCRQLTYRWARLGEARYVNYVHLPRASTSATSDTAVGRHVRAYRAAVLRRLYDGGPVERTVTMRSGAAVTTDKLSEKQMVSIVHYHPDLIPHLLREKEERKRKLEKYQVPNALGERAGLEEEDKAPIPLLDSDGLPSFFAVPHYTFDDATADVERAEAKYKEAAKLLTKENQAIVDEMKANPTKYMLEIHAQKRNNTVLLQENKELKERVKSKNAERFIVEEKGEQLLKALEKMARRLDTWERSAAVAPAPFQSARDLYREVTGRDLGEEGYYGVQSGGIEKTGNESKETSRKTWSDPRMERAVQAKWDDPSLSAERALRTGGFDFPPLGPGDVAEKSIVDADNVSFAKRKAIFFGAWQRRKKAHAKKTGDYSILERAPTDPRMDRAVAAMLADPSLGTEEGLRIGGFDFPSLEGVVIKNVVDADNVNVAKRKHALLAKLRKVKAKEGRPIQKEGSWHDARKGNKPGDVSAVAKEPEGVQLANERAEEEMAEESEEAGMAEEPEEDKQTKESSEVTIQEEPDVEQGVYDVQDEFLRG